MMRLKKSQVAAEYLIVISLSFLVLIFFAANFQDSYQTAKASQERELVRDLAEMVQQEIILASNMEEGYARTFYIPESLEEVSYTIENSPNAIIVRSENVDYDLPIPEVRGVLSKGANTIRSLNGLICLGNVSCDDTTPPSVNYTSPNGTIATTSVELTAQTDEDAICKYSSEDKDFYSMRSFLQGTSLSHSATITLPEGNYTYYVRCQDKSGNAMNYSSQIAFEIRLPETTPPNVTLLLPLNSSVVNESMLRLVYMVNDASAIMNCTLLVNSTPSVTNSSVAKGINQSFYYNFTQGNYTWQVGCYDYYSNNGASEERSLFVVSVNGT